MGLRPSTPVPGEVAVIDDLALLILHPSTEAELRWYYDHEERAGRLASSHEALVAMALVGPASSRSAAGGYAASERQLEDSARARRVRERLQQLSVPDRRVLQACYAPLPLPRRTAADWERLASRVHLPAGLLLLLARRRGGSLRDLESEDGKALLALAAAARIARSLAGGAYEMARGR